MLKLYKTLRASYIECLMCKHFGMIIALSIHSYHHPYPTNHLGLNTIRESLFDLLGSLYWEYELMHALFMFMVFQFLP